MTALYVTLSKFLQGQQGRSQNCLIMHSLKEHLYHRYFLLSLVIFNCNLWIKSEHLVSKHLFLILYFNPEKNFVQTSMGRKRSYVVVKSGLFFCSVLCFLPAAEFAKGFLCLSEWGAILHVWCQFYEDILVDSLRILFSL